MNERWDYMVIEKLKNEIAYQNKDIASKIFAEKFAGKSLNVYGIDLPKIKQVLSTNLPVIQANELRMDNLFLLEDDTFLLVDYESTYKQENMLKYLNYVLRVLERYNKDYGIDMQIFVVIIYTADVSEEVTRDTLDVHSVSMKLEQAYLSRLDSELIKADLTSHIKQGKKLTDEQLMQYIILPLTYSGEEKKKIAIKELFELTKDIKEEETQLFLLSGILVFTDKVIDEETAKQIKEWIRMTKVARLFEEEKLEAVNEIINQKEKEKIEAVNEVLYQKENAVKQIAKNLLDSGIDILYIMKATGLTKRELEEIKNQ